jgi:hypothetical protein
MGVQLRIGDTILWPSKPMWKKRVSQVLRESIVSWPAVPNSHPHVVLCLGHGGNNGPLARIDDADWAHLSSHYDYLFFQPGNAYYEVHTAYHDPERPARYWHLYRTWMDRLLSGLGGYRWGIGVGELTYTDGEYPGNQIFYSDELQSFFHFKIGERAVPLGSTPGVLYAQVSHLIAQSTMMWRSRSSEEESRSPEKPKRLGVEIEYLEEQ